MESFKPKRLFTLDEANRMLPLVSRIARDVSTTYRQLAEQYERYRRVCPADPHAIDESHLGELDAMRTQIEREGERIAEFAEELNQLGVLLKGEADGLVDFPAEREGRIVFLCWKLGEPAVQYWHEIDAGFRGRQAIEADAFCSIARVD